MTFLFGDVKSIEELNKRRTEMLSDLNLPDEQIAEINREFSTRRRQISLSQRSKNTVLMPFRIITHTVTDPSITVDAVFNPDAMLLTILTPLQTPFIRDSGLVSVHNQVNVIFDDLGNSTVVYSNFS